MRNNLSAILCQKEGSPSPSRRSIAALGDVEANLAIYEQRAPRGPRPRRRPARVPRALAHRLLPEGHGVDGRARLDVARAQAPARAQPRDRRIRRGRWSRRRRSTASTTPPCSSTAARSGTCTARSTCRPTACSTSSATSRAATAVRAFDSRFGRARHADLRGPVAPVDGLRRRRWIAPLTLLSRRRARLRGSSAAEQDDNAALLGDAQRRLRAESFGMFARLRQPRRLRGRRRLLGRLGDPRPERRGAGQGALLRARPDRRRAEPRRVRRKRIASPHAARREPRSHHQRAPAHPRPRHASRCQGRGRGAEARGRPRAA